MKSHCLAALFSTVLASLAVAGPPGRVERALITVSNPPPVRMLVPGFTVRELPLRLNNLNSLAFAPDGRCFALAYDGNVFQLHDTDGDGLEDKATYFHRNDRNEIPPSIGMSWGPGGLYIASQGRVIRLRDIDDGTSELETVTSGWVKPTGVAGSNLDSIGLAVNRKGEIFFGLGCDMWYDAYRPNKETGGSDYNLHSERGTILKISRDWKRRDIVCTGLRFPVSMAFNAAGDLFCTDQEGATWLPNGNPFDELLHIQPRRHYGFPPRHPKYLPDVIDEPSTFDYGPQHQSTCGLHFNDGKKVFGPEWWRGDAFIAGESRGKIWRTKLVKTAAGYVAQNNLIACLSLLTLDAVPTPQGDLLVCCHSGQPDWGTGPQGQGKLFKISYTDKIAPQPVLTFAADPGEARVVFDRVVPPKPAAELARASAVAMGKYVTAGEQFESFRPGYQVVKLQKTMPRFELPVHAVHLAPDRRSIRLRTQPRAEAVSYAFTLGEATELAHDLTGVEAAWSGANGRANWSGWLPHLDLDAVRGLTDGSAEHGEFFRRLRQRGRLILRTRIDLWQMLHPAVQPEAKLDFEYPPERVTLVLKSNRRLAVKARGDITGTDENEVRVTVMPKQHEWLPLAVELATGSKGPRLDVSWFTAEDPRPRPLPLRRVLLPWAEPYTAVIATKPVLELAGGDWARGRKLFFSDPASCSKCHTLGGEGGEIGPNLSNLIYRDYASVLRDITEPSAAINPDHVSYNVTLTTGEVESGVLLRNDHEEVILGQASGQSRKIPGNQVASMKASTVSVMPEGLLQALTPEQQRDLLTFLLAPRPAASE